MEGDEVYSVRFSGAELDVVEVALEAYARSLKESDDDWEAAWSAYHKVSTE